MGGGGEEAINLQELNVNSEVTLGETIFCQKNPEWNVKNLLVNAKVTQYTGSLNNVIASSCLRSKNIVD